MKKQLIVKPIPISAIDHPAPPDDILPKHEWSMGFIAPKGSGKTTCLIRLLDFYKGYYNSVIVFSPTVKNDEKWDWVKRQKLLSPNKRLDNIIRTIIHKKQNKAEQEGIVDRTHQYEKDDEDLALEKYLTPDEFDGTISESFFIEDYNEDTLQQVMDQQKELIHLLKEYGYTKHYANRVLIIFDDLVGSALFSSKRRSPFKMLAANQRHLSFSVIMVSQAYKEIPKTVRTQFSCLIIFEIPNESEIDVIYKENPVGYNQKDWMEMYEYAVDGEYNFMFINYMKPKKLRIMKNFREYLFIKH